MANFLNLRCPRCRRDDRIDIQAVVWLRVGICGTDPESAPTEGHFDYTPQSLAICENCSFNSRLCNFHVAAGGTR